MGCMHAHLIQTLGWFEEIVVWLSVWGERICGLLLTSANNLPSLWPMRQAVTALCKLNILLEEKLGHRRQIESTHQISAKKKIKKNCITTVCVFLSADVFWSMQSLPYHYPEGPCGRKPGRILQVRCNSVFPEKGERKISENPRTVRITPGP